MRGCYVGYDLATSDKDHPDLLRALEALDGRRVDSDLWLVEGEQTPGQLFQALSPYVREDDILIVEEADQERALVPVLRATA